MLYIIDVMDSGAVPDISTREFYGDEIASTCIERYNFYPERDCCCFCKKSSKKSKRK